MRAMPLLLACVVVGGAVLTGCGGHSGSAEPTVANVSALPAPPVPVADITISNFAFAVPAPLKPGQQVTVINDDQSSHSLSADANDAFDVRVSGGGGIATFAAPTTPGVYPFHCKYHANMHGSLTVQ